MNSKRRSSEIYVIIDNNPNKNGTMTNGSLGMENCIKIAYTPYMKMNCFQG